MNGDNRYPRSHLSVEAVLVHSQISRCIPESKPPRLDSLVGRAHFLPSERLSDLADEPSRIDEEHAVEFHDRFVKLQRKLRAPLYPCFMNQPVTEVVIEPRRLVARPETRKLARRELPKTLTDAAADLNTRQSIDACENQHAGGEGGILVSA